MFGAKFPYFLIWSRGELCINKIIIDGCSTSSDPGDQILLKIQSAQNHFKSNGSIGLVVTNPMQLVWVQTDVGSERYHVLFKMTNMQKKGMLTVQFV